MSRTFRVLPAAAICLLTACGGMMVEPELSVLAAPKTLNGTTQKAKVTVVGADEEGKPATGSVRLEATAGTIEDPQAIFTDGEALTNFACNRTMDAACAGPVTITASWTTKKGKALTATVVVTISVPDAGSDAGLDAGVDAGVDAGIDAGVDAGNPFPDAGLALDAGRATLFIGAQDAVPLTATLSGVAPLLGAPLQFATSLGLLRANADAGAAGTLDLLADSSGVATAELVDSPGQIGGRAVVTVTHAPSGRSANLGVDLVTLRQVSHIETRCNGVANCTLIYAQGSGNGTSAQVTFRVIDGFNRPAPGVRVNFSLVGVAPGVVVSPASSVTNAMGEATTSVNSGPAAAVFRVHATVVPGQVEGDSLNIAVRGGKASNRGITIHCPTVNLAAFKAPVPPLALNLDCSVRLVDRNNNPVGTGVIVNFKTEAGTVSNSVTTQAYMPGGMNEGTGTFSLQTTGGTWPPVDTTPFPALASQFPFPRVAEPSRTDASLVRNPRDGLVTVLAYVIGEEHFDDNNANGTHDANEPFVDQGEPFVDANDNDVWDATEYYVDENGDNAWSPPNGQYDAVKAIWTEFRVLMTNAAEPGVGTIEGAVPALCPGGLPKGGSVDLNVFLPDRNLNRIEAGAALNISRTSTRGTVALLNTTVLDNYGFDYERVLVDATTPTQACTAASTRCVFHHAFGTWSRGYVGGVRLTGTSVTDTSVCGNEPGLSVGATTRGTPISTTPITYGIQ